MDHSLELKGFFNGGGVCLSSAECSQIYVDLRHGLSVLRSMGISRDTLKLEGKILQHHIIIDHDSCMLKQA